MSCEKSAVSRSRIFRPVVASWSADAGTVLTREKVLIAKRLDSPSATRWS
jgi:hypothetical protein